MVPGGVSSIFRSITSVVDMVAFCSGRSSGWGSRFRAPSIPPPCTYLHLVYRLAGADNIGSDCAGDTSSLFSPGFAADDPAIFVLSCGTAMVIVVFCNRKQAVAGHRKKLP